MPNNILQFRRTDNFGSDLVNRVNSLLEDYYIEQIICALFKAATDQNDEKAMALLMPAWVKVVDSHEK